MKKKNPRLSELAVGALRSVPNLPLVWISNRHTPMPIAFTASNEVPSLINVALGVEASGEDR